MKQKQDAALTNKGGGKAGLADRKGGAAGHAKFKCPVCGMAAPSIKSGELHWDSKHGKLPFKPEDWSDLHALHGGTTIGVAVRGAEKEKTVHELKKTEAGRKKLGGARKTKAREAVSRGEVEVERQRERGLLVVVVVAIIASSVVGGERVHSNLLLLSLHHCLIMKYFIT